MRRFIGLFDWACLAAGVVATWWAVGFMVRQLAAVGRGFGWWP